MAKREQKQSPWLNYRPGQHSAAEFEHTVSPLGDGAREANGYSPDREVTGTQRPVDRKSSKTYSGRESRRS